MDKVISKFDGSVLIWKMRSLMLTKNQVQNKIKFSGSGKFRDIRMYDSL
jgi:hypothetical protein